MYKKTQINRCSYIAKTRFTRVYNFRCERWAVTLTDIIYNKHVFRGMVTACMNSLLSTKQCTPCLKAHAFFCNRSRQKENRIYVQTAFGFCAYVTRQLTICAISRLYNLTIVDLNIFQAISLRQSRDSIHYFDSYLSAAICIFID